MTLRSEFSKVGFARHRRYADSAVQPHGVAILVDQFDAVDAVRSARCTAELGRQFDQHPGVYIGGSAEAWIYREMQHRDPFVRRATENGNARRFEHVGY